MSQSGDFVVSEGWDSASGSGLSHLVRLFGVLEGLPGMLMSGLVFLLPMLFTGAMGVRGEVV
jgi:hypothetical protein